MVPAKGRPAGRIRSGIVFKPVNSQVPSRSAALRTASSIRESKAPVSTVPSRSGPRSRVYPLSSAGLQEPYGVLFDDRVRCEAPTLLPDVRLCEPSIQRTACLRSRRKDVGGVSGSSRAALSNPRNSPACTTGYPRSARCDNMPVYFAPSGRPSLRPAGQGARPGLHRPRRPAHGTESPSSPVHHCWRGTVIDADYFAVPGGLDSSFICARGPRQCVIH